MRTVQKYEIFRVITPILVTLCLTVLGAIWRSMDEIQKDVVVLKIDVATLKEKATRVR